MSISKNVIRDLLPVYVAGEASEETRALVAEACASDAELRAEVESLGAVEIPDLAPPPELGMASLKRTQKLLRERTFLVGFGYCATTLPLALIGRPFAGALILATLCMAAAITGWIYFLRNALRLRATGLEPPRSRWPMLCWYLGSVWISLSVASVVYAWLGKNFLAHPNTLVSLAIWAPLLWLGQKLRQYREPEAVFRTETLFTLVRDQDRDRASE